MIDQRYSTHDLYSDFLADEADEHMQWRKIFERGGREQDYQWCTERRRMRLRTEPLCAECVGSDPRNSSCCPQRRY